jgi:pre-60S factor REI1
MIGSKWHLRSGTSRRVDKNSVYNLKRRIASLPPISVIVYHKQVLNSDTGNDETDASSPFQQSCIACEQYYTNRKAWQAHLNSRNHIQKSAEFNSKASFVSDESPSLGALSLTSRDEGQSADEEENFNPSQCLFCNAESTSMDSNLTHMSHAHSFFIPDTAYLIDMESLLSYLFAIVSVFHECLFCGSLRSTKVGVQDHMRGKGHCKLDFEDDEHELKQFYDFSGDVDDDGEELEEEVTLVPDEDELRLPSGKTLGHRSRARYFRRNISERSSSAPSSQQQPLAETESETVPKEWKDRRVALRAGTSTSLIGVPQLQQRALMAIENKMLKMETRAKNEYQSIVEKGGNKQKWFRAKGIGKKRGGLEKRLG